MEYPNKTFLLNTDRVNVFGSKYRTIIIIIADTKETATKYIKDNLGFDGDNLIWLMNCNHPTLYTQNGSKPLDVQAKIIYNSSVPIV